MGKVAVAADLREHYTAAIRAGYESAAHQFGEDVLPDEHEAEGLRSMLKMSEHQAAQMEHSVIDAPWTRPKIAGLLQDWLATADETGTINLNDLTMALEPMFGISRALMIARTETAMTYNGAKIAALQSHGWKMVDWLAADDACPECRELADSSPMSVEEYEANIEPHPNCVTGETLVDVDSNILAATSRWYSGRVVVLRTAGGKFLTATPNHPILTPRGWAPASSLVEGGDIICGADHAFRRPVKLNEHDSPASIEKIFESNFGSRKVTITEVVKTSDEDFHGDGKGSKVCVVRTDRLLRRKVQAAALQQAAQLVLGRACVKHLRLARPGPRFFDLHRIFLSATRSLPSSRSRFDPLRPLAIGNDSHRFGQRSHLDAGLDESRSDSSSADAMPALELEEIITGKVFADHVVEIRNENFSGHVFNLQTRRGYFSAGGIITHNCSCSVAPAAEESEGEEEGEEAG